MAYHLYFECKIGDQDKSWAVNVQQMGEWQKTSNALSCSYDLEGAK